MRGVPSAGKTLARFRRLVASLWLTPKGDTARGASDSLFRSPRNTPTNP